MDDLLGPAGGDPVPGEVACCRAAREHWIRSASEAEKLWSLARLSCSHSFLFHFLSEKFLCWSSHLQISLFDFDN